MSRRNLIRKIIFHSINSSHCITSNTRAQHSLPDSSLKFKYINKYRHEISSSMKDLFMKTLRFVLFVLFLNVCTSNYSQL